MTAATMKDRLSTAEVIELQQPFSAIGLEDLLKRQFPPKEMLLAPWLPFKGVAMVFAPRGAGKTHFALGVAYAVASGGSYLGWHAPRARKVLVIDGEMPAASLQERWMEIVAKSPKEPPAEGYVRILASDLSEFGLPDLSTEKGQEAIQPHISDAELIVVDNLSTLARSGKENESESWGMLQSWALKQRREGRSVLFVHHAGKGGEQRGTSKREDVMDSVIKLSLPSDYSPVDGARFVVQFTKSRGFSGPQAEPFEAALRNGLWSTKSLEDVRTAQILELHAEGLNQRDIASEVGCSAATVNRVIKRSKVGD
jgi:KaiC/GvpD/RAD55 family RecA-like ATPase